MNKALETLKEVLELQDMGHTIEAKIKEAIAELEEAMKPKSCDGCKYGKFGADSRGIEVECTLIWHCARGNGFPDRYEPKEMKC